MFLIHFCISVCATGLGLSHNPSHWLKDESMGEAMSQKNDSGAMSFLYLPL